MAETPSANSEIVKRYWPSPAYLVSSIHGCLAEKIDGNDQPVVKDEHRVPFLGDYVLLNLNKGDRPSSKNPQPGVDGPRYRTAEFEWAKYPSGLMVVRIAFNRDRPPVHGFHIMNIGWKGERVSDVEPAYGVGVELQRCNIGAYTLDVNGGVQEVLPRDTSLALATVALGRTLRCQ